MKKPVSDSDDLFSVPINEKSLPLAHRMRPRTLSEWIGHEKVLGKNGVLHALMKAKNFPSILLWGPPGVGKTSLALLIGEELREAVISLSAVTAGVREIKEAADRAQANQRMGRRSVLFFDEIHRLNKAQQDALLPFVEKGLFILIGATTENPSFEVNAALLSRLRVLRLDRLTDEDLLKILDRAISSDQGFSNQLQVDREARQILINQSEGDARRVLTLLDTVVAAHPEWKQVTGTQMKEAIENLGDRVLPYDKASEEHHNTISAFIKSMRASDPDAAVYYLARMLESGEDPNFIARRMIIFASEDIGNAEPRGLLMAIAAQQALEFVGLPEARINLAHAAISLALAKKDRRVYEAIDAALAEVRETGALPIPMVLRNPVTNLMKSEGYGAGDPAKRLPDGLKQTKFW